MRRTDKECIAPREREPMHSASKKIIQLKNNTKRRFSQMGNKELTVEDVMSLVELAGRVQKRGHFVGVDFANVGNDVEVRFMRGGFRGNKDFDMFAGFHLSQKEENINEYHSVVLFLTRILEERKPMTVSEIEEALGYKIQIVYEGDVDGSKRF